MSLPGVMDFLTIEKYVLALLPKSAEDRELPSLATLLLDMQKKEYIVDASKAALTLFAISFIFLLLSVWVIRRREYTSARIVQG